MADAATSSAHPALAAFVAALGREMVFAQVLIRREGRGFELRHAADAGRADLRPVKLDGVRALAQFTAAGEYRPLKSAPNLPSGWRVALADEEELGRALNAIYPGAVADWFAARAAPPPATGYREFAERQTGMYRIAATLPDPLVEAVAAACCHEEFCLKRRLWPAAGLGADDPARKSAIPCLEPCAILLEFARATARREKDPQAPDADGDNPLQRRFMLEKRRFAGT